MSPSPQKPEPDPDDPDGLTRLRRGTLVALYGALSLLSALLVLAGFFLWPALNAPWSFFKVLLLLTAGLVSTLTCGRASWDLMTSYFMDRKQDAAHGPAPEFQLVPLFFVALTLFAASWLFLALPVPDGG